jgi:uncharacterized protein YaaQ
MVAVQLKQAHGNCVLKKMIPGGIYSISQEDSSAASTIGFLKEGDQLIAVNTMDSGLDDALRLIVDSEGLYSAIISW